MDENYLMLNGQRVLLTEEQIEKIKSELKIEEKNCFTRANKNDNYFYIGADGIVYKDVDIGSTDDDKCYKIANYCTDKKLLEQRALHETLNRLLWRFSMQNDGDKIDWKDDENDAHKIIYNYEDEDYEICNNSYKRDLSSAYFHKREIAKKAIKEIIEPFIKEHPEFTW